MEDCVVIDDMLGIALYAIINRVKVDVLDVNIEKLRHVFISELAVEDRDIL